VNASTDKPPSGFVLPTPSRSATDLEMSHFVDAVAELATATHSPADAPSRGSLADAVLAAVRTVPEEALWSPRGERVGIAFQSRSLLALLTCCYANGIYASDEIEDRMSKDSAFCGLCGGEFPDALLLQHFRRFNRDAVIGCLGSVLHQQQRPCPGAAGDELQPWCREEAQQRIDIAILSDLDD
jgi:hypothetical protein